MTKKEFKERCGFHKYGTRNAIYFDWKSEQTNGKWVVGYKYMVKADNKNLSKTELLNLLYEWVTKQIQPSYLCLYKYASTDEERFKVPIMG